MGGAPFQAKSEVSIVKVFPAFIQSFPKTVMARSHAVDRTHCHNALAEAFTGIPVCFT